MLRDHSRDVPSTGRWTAVGRVAARLAAALLLAAALPSVARPQAGPGGTAVGQPSPRVTPVSGSSWMEVRGTSMQRSSMGRAGRSAPEMPAVTFLPTSELQRIARPDPPALTEKFELTGADLYRLSCRSCHTAAGTGNPPEIRSLIDPIRATSAELTVQQMEARGREIPKELADTLAAQARASFFQRLEHGGQRMPIFNHLATEEIDALFLYLQKLADVPGARERPPARVEASVARVGELLVKGTCHTCHAAAGRGGGPEVLQRGIIPSLDTFPQQKPVSFLVQKVREGAPIGEGWSGRGRMPVFSYLTEDEVRAAYTYLVLYPPVEP